ncbi:MAG: hypothetical protein EP343_07420 [Deltaproteobacteria bacterium]|nr:MAG: hypothetical protein EP343_07420 [Deltaproteobacteria bacterium]
MNHYLCWKQRVFRFLGLFVLATGVVHFASPAWGQALPKFAGTVTSVAIKTIYVKFPGHRFRPGDVFQLMRKRQPLGFWKVIAASSQFFSARHHKGSQDAKAGDQALGKGSFVEKEESREPLEVVAYTLRQVRQLWRSVTRDIGERISFRGQPDALKDPRNQTRIDYAITLQYLGSFSRGGAWQTALLESRMNVEQILGTGVWHRHLVRLRYDFSRNRYPWGDRFRPNLEVYQLSAGYRFQSWGIGAGRIARVPSEVGLVDGIRLQVDPTSWLTLIAYGGLAPDERDLSIRTDQFRYGLTLQANEVGWHRYSRLGFSGQIYQGQMDRHLLFAETFLQPIKWMEVFGRGVVEVLIPTNTFARTAPEVSSATADIRVYPVRWFQASVRYDYFRPALNLSWMQDLKEVLPAEGYDAYFRDEPRHSIRGAVEFSHVKATFRAGASFDALLNDGTRWVATGWFHWYEIFRQPLRLYASYSYLGSPDFMQGHRANVSIGTSFPSWMSVTLGYRADVYLLPQETWQIEHTARANIDFALPLGFYINLSGQIRFGDFDQGIFIFSQLGWRFQRK